MLPSAVTLLPTPSVADSMGGHLTRSGERSGELLLPGIAKEIAHAGFTEARPGEELRGVREANDPQEVRQRAARGQDGVPQAASLLTELCEHSDAGHPLGASIPGEAVPEADVRGVRDSQATACSPRGPELAERRPIESPDALRVLPSKTALAGGPGAAHGCCEASRRNGVCPWGIYSAAIHRWEVLLGRIAPPPTSLSKKGTPRLSAAFSEFMMGLPAGWVTDVPGISRNEALRMLGNGVVPQQAAAGIATALAHLTAVERAA